MSLSLPLLDPASNLIDKVINLASVKINEVEVKEN